MNFIGIDVDGLDLNSFFLVTRALYVVLFGVWLVAVWKNWRRSALAGLIGLALGCWLMATFPLQRSYGLAEGTDRLRNLSWCSTVAAGNSASSSGILDGKSFEPAWSLFVATLSLWDPARVPRVYAFLPALALVVVGIALFGSFLRIAPDDAFERAGADDRWRLALWTSFFVLLASVGPLDFLNPYRGFWAKSFLLKPNHALAFAFVPVVATLLSKESNLKRSVLAAALLGVMGWVFITYWALLCWGLFLYGVWTSASKRRESLRLAGALFASLVVVAPYLYFLVVQFPVTVNFETGAFPENPLMSVWGDTPSRSQSMFFLVTFDLGANFYLMLFSLWSAWRRRSHFDRLWSSVILGAYSAFAVSCYLLFTGRARQSDEVYYFLVFVVAVSAGLGAYRLAERVQAFFDPPMPFQRFQAGAFLLLLPLTLGWWWNPVRMDAHFRMGLRPLPWQVADVGQWLRDNTRGSDIVLAYGRKALFVPALSGRRVLFGEHVEQAQTAMAQRLVTYAVLEPGESLAFAEGRATLELEYQAGETKVYAIRYGPKE